jgi:hypothetical protein
MRTAVKATASVRRRTDKTRQTVVVGRKLEARPFVPGQAVAHSRKLSDCEGALAMRCSEFRRRETELEAEDVMKRLLSLCKAANSPSHGNAARSDSSSVGCGHSAVPSYRARSAPPIREDLEQQMRALLGGPSDRRENVKSGAATSPCDTLPGFALSPQTRGTRESDGPFGGAGGASLGKCLCVWVVHSIAGVFPGGSKSDLWFC